MVNIAVFATFWPRVGGILLANAAFKPVCAIRPLDMSRYGWQKWQETATIWQGRRQKWQGCETFCRVHAVRLAAVRGCGWGVWHDMRCFKVLAARGGARMIEQKYHDISGKSRWRGGSCRAFSPRRAGPLSRAVRRAG